MRIGLDVHGVIDRFPREFAWLTQRWVRFHRHEVHIVTGEGWDTAASQVEGRGIVHTNHFSIVDHHRSIGTPMELKDSGWWMPQQEWDMSKGAYAKRVGLDIHFEDTLAYAPWFPSSCAFIHVGKDFETVLKVMRDFNTAFDYFHGIV
jgi:hypothetical protein